MAAPETSKKPGGHVHSHIMSVASEYGVSISDAEIKNQMVSTPDNKKVVDMIEGNVANDAAFGMGMLQKTAAFVAGQCASVEHPDAAVTDMASAMRAWLKKHGPKKGQ